MPKATKLAVQKTANNKIKIGSRVKVSIRHARGTAHRTGAVKRMIPRGATRGAARITVKDEADGRIFRPFLCQCQAIG